MTKHRTWHQYRAEDYTSSHVKGRIRYNDEDFLIVKERIDGKPHPRYMALLTVDRQMVAAGSLHTKGRGDDGPVTEADWLAKFAEFYGETKEGREAMRTKIREIVL